MLMIASDNGIIRAKKLFDAVPNIATEILANTPGTSALTITPMAAKVDACCLCSNKKEHLDDYYIMHRKTS